MKIYYKDSVVSPSYLNFLGSNGKVAITSLHVVSASRFAVQMLAR